MFNVPVISHKPVSLTEEVREKLVDYALLVEQEKDNFLISGIDNYQSPYVEKEIFSHVPEFKKVVGEVINLANELTPIPETLRVKIGESWFNISHGKGVGTHTPHNHGAGWWSLIFYVQAPENSGLLVLRNPLPFWDGTGQSESLHVTPVEGAVIGLPPYLLHWVTPNTSDVTRISLSMNLYLEPKDGQTA